MCSNDPLNNTILKQDTTDPLQGKTDEHLHKPITFSNNSTQSAAPISPRRRDDYESMYKEYLKSVEMNGASSTPAATAGEKGGSAQDEDKADEVIMEVLEDPPKRKRGRPKGSGRRNFVHVVVPMKEPPPPTAPKRKRGWPLGVPRKPQNAASAASNTAPSVPVTPTVKKRPGRPRKIREFEFQSIVSDIKTVSLPSDLWSAHVSVTAKKSQVCFTRVVQTVSSAVPVECDRSVKFNGSVNYLVRINNQDVHLVGAPPAVKSLRDVEILLEIVNEIGINDPVIEFLKR